MKISSSEHHQSYIIDLRISLFDLAAMVRDHLLVSSPEAEKLKGANWHIWGSKRAQPVGTCEKNAPVRPERPLEDGEPGEDGKHRDERG